MAWGAHKKNSLEWPLFNLLHKCFIKFSGPTCGAHFSAAFDLRVGGPTTDTVFGEWPHVCALFKVIFLLWCQ